MPETLPTSVLAGDTAIYPELLPGVDLRVRVEAAATAACGGTAVVAVDALADPRDRWRELPSASDTGGGGRDHNQRSARWRRPAGTDAARIPTDACHVAPGGTRSHVAAHVVCADLRGYGDSDKPDSDPEHQPHAKRVMARDQVELMRALGFDLFAVVGCAGGAGRGPGGRPRSRTQSEPAARCSAVDSLVESQFPASCPLPQGVCAFRTGQMVEMRPPSITKSAPVTLSRRLLASMRTKSATSRGRVNRPLTDCPAAPWATDAASPP